MLTKTPLTLCMLFACSILLVLACKPKTQNPTPEQEEVIVSDDSPALFQLEGTVGDLPVHMYLTRKKTTGYEDEVLVQYNGQYFYDAFEAPIALGGSMDSLGTLVLDEYSYNYGEEESKAFHFTTVGDTFTGTWKTKGKELPVVLHKMKTGTQFTYYSVEDSLEYETKVSTKPMMRFSGSALWPENNDATLSAFLISQLVGEAKKGAFKTPTQAFEATKKESFEQFKSTMTEMGIDTTTNPDDIGVSMMNHDQSIEMNIIYNSDDILTTCVMEYSYSGGAHGNYGSGYGSFDKKTGSTLKLSDIFKPGFEKPLSDVLEKTLLKKYQVTKLTEVLFDDNLEHNENFGITGKGIIFNYVPYEVSAYAMGEITLFVPFSEIKKELNQSFIDRFNL